MDEQNKGFQQEMPGTMLWAVFLVLIIAGVSALINFPAQVGYGLVATIIFRVVVAVILLVVTRRFLIDIRKFNQLSKGGRG